MVKYSKFFYLILLLFIAPLICYSENTRKISEIGSDFGTQIEEKSRKIGVRNYSILGGRFWSAFFSIFDDFRLIC